MKSFKTYLTEDKDRFIKKNKHLTNDQKDEVIKFFRMNRQAEKKIDWNRSKTMTYDEFADIMIQTKSGRKTIIKHQAIKGSKEGTDYVHVRMPSKEYLAYIPLNYETAQKFNTRELGVCSGPWCIGHSGDPYHWNDEVISDQQVPVYVVNRHSKWVVMIKEGNRAYDVWTVENKPELVKQGIPDFSIRKNLLSGKQKEMYDEIREDYYDEEQEPEEIDVDDAIVDYDNLVEDIDNSEGARESAEEYAREQFYEEAYRIKSDTKDKYDELRTQANDIFDALDELFNEGEALKATFEEEYDEWHDNGEEGDEPTTQFDGEELTYSELEDRVDDLEIRKDGAYDEYDKIDDILRSIDNVEEYEMYNNDDIEWTEDPPNEDYIYEDLDIDTPSISDHKYSDYIDLAEEHMGFSSRHSNVDADIQDFAYGNSRYGTAEELLGNNDLYHPDAVNEH